MGLQRFHAPLVLGLVWRGLARGFAHRECSFELGVTVVSKKATYPLRNPDTVANPFRLASRRDDISAARAGFNLDDTECRKEHPMAWLV